MRANHRFLKSPGRARRFASLAAAFLLIAASPGAAAQVRGLTVTGRGTVVCPSDHMAIKAVVKGAAETALDATAKYEQARDRFSEAIGELGLKTLEIEGGEVRVELRPVGSSGPVRFHGMEQEGAEDMEYVVSETVKLKLGGIAGMKRSERLKALGEILECMRDCGIELQGTLRGSNAYMGFRHMESGDGQAVAIEYAGRAEGAEEATRRALEDAKARAQRLAEAAGVKVGAIVGIHGGKEGAIVKRGEDDAVLTVELTVAFEIE